MLLSLNTATCSVPSLSVTITGLRVIISPAPLGRRKGGKGNKVGGKKGRWKGERKEGRRGGEERKKREGAGRVD